jgi:SPP1 gp7 family putative phage head morphogenesis protein
MYKRFRWLKGEIREYIVDDEAISPLTPIAKQESPIANTVLKWNEHFNPVLLQSNAMSQRTGQVFYSTRDVAKIAQFMDWLEERQERGILRSIEGPGQAVVGEARWTDVYVESSYKRSMNDAYKRAQKAGIVSADANIKQAIQAAFNAPIHADRLGILFTRAYEELRGITSAMDQQISRVLAEGVADGLNPRVIAKQINGRVDKIGITRARTLARTEVIRAHAEAGLNTYESLGVEQVELEVEFSAANDDRTCPICAGYSGSTYTLENARGIIPVHPNCRCVWLPRNVKSGKKKRNKK